MSAAVHAPNIPVNARGFLLDVDVLMVLHSPAFLFFSRFLILLAVRAKSCSFHVRVNCCTIAKHPVKARGVLLDVDVLMVFALACLFLFAQNRWRVYLVSFPFS